MCVRKDLDNRVLFITGSSLVALQIIIRVIIARTIGASDGSDFGLGALLGVGLGCLLLFVWRLGRQRHSNG